MIHFVNLFIDALQLDCVRLSMGVDHIDNTIIGSPTVMVLIAQNSSTQQVDNLQEVL